VGPRRAGGATRVIVAHLSDLHLGFRAYGRIERDANMRERDVAAAFDRAVQEVVRLAPDVIVVSGDVFDRPDPPASAVVALARGLETLGGRLPEVPVLMAAGPRDTPRRSGDPGALAVLDSFPNVEAATGLTRSIQIKRLGLHACLVPYRAVRRQPPAPPDPDPRMRWNVLVLHAEAAQSSAGGLHLDPQEWDYIALGGEHRKTKLAERVWYPGSLERVALDPWDEAADQKGFLTVDLESGETEFHTIPGRPVVALAPVKVMPPDPDRIRRRVRAVMAEVPGGIADKIVRLRLQGASPMDVLALQGEPLLSLRGEALHLAVEAGKDVDVPVSAWLADDLPTAMRAAVLAELDHDGVTGAEATQILERVIPEDGAPSTGAHGDIDALDGMLPGLGRVSTSIPPGLTAVLGGGGRARRAVAELYLSAGRTGPDGAVRRWWAGVETETLDSALRRAIEAVAESRGLGLVDGALDTLGANPPPLDPAPVEPSADSPLRGSVRIDPESVVTELGIAAQELITSRADVTETDGDLEVATMDWHRERQDAETTLHAYRDRARELRNRIRRMESAGAEAPCPMCGRVLQTHYDEVLSELRDEWESVVQDGSWWKSRWEQLEPKPVHLQELELRSFTLHAALEAGSERVEALRSRLRQLEGGLGPPAAPVEGPEGAVVEALLRVRSARVARATDLLLDRASRFVSRISGGRILAITQADGVVHLQGSVGPLAPLSEEDLALGRVAVRLATASLVAARGRIVASMMLEEPFDRLDEEARVRALRLTKSLLRDVPRVILFSRGDVVEGRPELFDYVLEVKDEGTLAGPVLRPVPAGPGRVVLAAPARPRPAGIDRS